MRKVLSFIAFLTCLLLPFSVKAQDVLKVAAAANLLFPMQKIAKTYEKQTGTKIDLVFSSSGKLTALISKGAPFDIFFSADAKRPEYLAQKDICLPPKVYTYGVLAFWSKKKELCKAGWPEVLKKINSLAIADPKLAPYGEAAVFALSKTSFKDSLKNKIRKAMTVSQAFQWAESGNACGALVSLSLAMSPRGQKGCFFKVPGAPPIKQKACVVKRGKVEEAQKFLQFVLSKPGQEILSEYGYLPLRRK
ncbi:molybdate ABC transporter substrate-binding protein [Thermodesulfatator atlanticus]|uniref:molybdate ABC transporter substrate-binding protein n=1 Tax=Thermodesulfatator atlanticus TaxID=501497 RepID=UPI0003B5F389|nr:molybdate ABC transporter substrate-binding protein [Thermodesulfatator atlanticus]